MSHNAERKEKDCLNCGTLIHGRYCHVCGQENIVPKETYWNLVIHFFYDITHFDSKFFDTLRYLIYRPGFLSKEYLKGRRVSYLNPVRMYLFTSAIFFLIFFAFRDPLGGFNTNMDDVLSKAQRDSAIRDIEKELKAGPYNEKKKKVLDLLHDTSGRVTWGQVEDDFRLVSTGEIMYADVKEYDSIQKTLPAAKKDGWIKRRWMRKEIDLNNKFKRDPSGAFKEFSSTFMHKLPYLLFVSLPFFALILKLLYIRRKQFYYADHAVFSIHHYIFSFILLLFFFAVDELKDETGWGVFRIIEGILFFAWPVYLYIAMKNFYRQGWVKTFFKFFLLNILGVMVLAVLFIIFLFFSIIQL